MEATVTPYSFDPIAMAAIIASAAVIGLMIVVGLPVWMGIRQNRRDRDLQHAERMKALELGLIPPGEAPRPWTPVRLAAAIGLWVPIAVFGGAFLAASSGYREPGPWWAAGSIGVAAVLSGTFLILRLPATAWTTDLPRSDPIPRAQKFPVTDPDAFDVAGRRG
jgi:hypothetical protein